MRIVYLKGCGEKSKRVIKPTFSVQYSKNSLNPLSLKLQTGTAHFALSLSKGEESPPPLVRPKLRCRRGTARMTISSFPLAALNPRIREANTNAFYNKKLKSAMRIYNPFLACLKYAARLSSSTSRLISLTLGNGCIITPRLLSLSRSFLFKTNEFSTRS